MLSRFTIAGILVVVVSGLALISSAIRYFTAQSLSDRLVGAEGFSYAAPLLAYAFGLIILGAFGTRFLSRFKKNEMIYSLSMKEE